MTVSIFIPGQDGFIGGSSGGGGDVVGPASSADNQIAIFSGTSGKLLKVAPGAMVGTLGEMTVSSSSTARASLVVDATSYILNGLVEEWRASGNPVASVDNSGNFSANFYATSMNSAVFGTNVFLNSSSTIRWSSGSFYYDSAEVIIAKSATKTLTIDDGAAGPIKIGIVGNSGLGSAPTTTSFATFGASTTSLSSFNLPVGVAPTSPISGDVWREDDTATGLKIYVGGLTKTIVLA